jgi:NADH-dependent peroxiredoxin subunit F
MQENKQEINKEDNIYDLIIVGGGPAGASAAVYSARKQLKTLLILKEWGGQSIVSDDIQNWIGTPHISGADLAKSFRTHVEEYAGEFLTIKTGNNVNSAEKVKEGNLGLENKESNLTKIILENKEEFLGKGLLITTGSQRRKLEIPGAEIFDHKGLTYCATCDGPFYSGMDVVVVGGGNAGFESAAQLLAYCKSVTLLSRGEPRADQITIEKLKSNLKFKLIVGATPTEIHGDKFVNAISYQNENKEVVKLEIGGVFVEIGQIPATSWCKDIVELDEYGKVKIDPWTQKCVKSNLENENKSESIGKEIDGIWSAGDCTNILYHQNNIASGDAVRAIEDIYKTLKTK